MPSLRVLLVAAMALCLLASSPAFAQPAQEAIDDAISTVKAGGGEGVRAIYSFTSARNLLIKDPEQTLDAVLDLLNEMDVQSRINAAAILADIATKHGMNDVIADALVRCAQESNRGVVYIGCMALLSPNAPPAAVKVGLERSLGAEYGLNNSPTFRLAVANQVSDKKLVIALPYLLEHMQLLLKPFNQQLDTRLTYEEPDGTAPMAAVPAAPAAGIGGGAGRLTRPTAGGPTPLDYRRPMKRVRIDPDTLSLPEVQSFLPHVMRLPAVTEMQQMGLAVETLAKTVEPQADFGFETTPPWNYRQSLDKASAWYKANKGKIGAPDPEQTAVPEPEEAPAPEETPAPETEPAPSEG